VELDAFQHGPDWLQAPEEEFRKLADAATLAGSLGRSRKLSYRQGNSLTEGQNAGVAGLQFPSHISAAF